MLTLTGLVDNVYISNAGVNEKGDRYGGKPKLQLMTLNVLKNGETKHALVELTVSDVNKYKSKVGKEVSIEVGAMVLGSVVHFYTISEGRVLD